MLAIKEIKKRSFNNGNVYCIYKDNYPVEVTDTFLPFYTKNAINGNTNILKDYSLGSRKERWMIGVSCMSGCPVRCKFCATGSIKKVRNLTWQEIVAQVEFIISENVTEDFNKAEEHKINYTRMGEPFLNIDNVRRAIEEIEKKYPNTHHYLSTIGIKGSDFSWIKDNITLQISLHSLNEDKRNWLIPYKNKMSIEELGQIRTKSNLKTTINLTLVDEADFDIKLLKKYFDPEHFFIKISPVNPNEIAENNNINEGIIKTTNMR